MGFLSKLLRIQNKSITPNDSYSAQIEKCLVEIELTSVEYKLFSIYYYRGYTSYKDYFKNVFMRRMNKINKVVDGATKKAEKGCNIDFTFVRFIFNDQKYIDIPFDVFSDRKNMKISKRNTKLWNIANIKRMLIADPSLRELDDELLKEAINAVKAELED